MWREPHKKERPEEAAPAIEVRQTVLRAMRSGGRSELKEATWRVVG